jgi:hypothetical protein
MHRSRRARVVTAVVTCETVSVSGRLARPSISPAPCKLDSLVVFARLLARRRVAARIPTMPRKQPFPPEAETEPDRQPLRKPRHSGPAPKSKRARAEAPTEPPPRPSRKPDARSPGSHSGKAPKGRGQGATVDEVVADLSRDPRRERDE